MDNGVYGLPTTVDQSRYRKLKGLDNGELFFFCHVIRLYQCVAVVSDITVLPTVAIQRVDPDPCPAGLVVRPERLIYALVLFESLNQLPAGLGIISGASWLVLAVLDRKSVV